MKKVKSFKMLKSKKGIFFTLIAVALLGIILFSYSTTYRYSLQEKSSIIETRVDTMNRFLNSVDADMENAIYIAGYRSVVALTDYVTTNGTYVTSTTAALEELFLNGTIEGYSTILMVNNTFVDWMGKIKDKGQEVGINMTMEVTGVTVIQTSPWDLRFSVDSTVNISDQKSTANWSQDKTLSSVISILGFEDPWYALHTSGMIVKRINQSSYDNNFSVSNDTTNLALHVKNTYYIAWNASPSFMQRFENDHAPHEFGIESMVNKTEIMNYCSASISSVDTICWRQNGSVSTWNVEGMNASFRIDNQTAPGTTTGRIERYGLEDVVY